MGRMNEHSDRLRRLAERETCPCKTAEWAYIEPDLKDAADYIEKLSVIVKQLKIQRDEAREVAEDFAAGVVGKYSDPLNWEEDPL
jgi:hypothetical protein